jgi:PAS domain S-box-containing protein
MSPLKPAPDTYHGWGCAPLPTFAVAYIGQHAVFTVMSPDSFAHALTTVLLQQAAGFVGVYEAATGRLTQVNPAGAQLLGYPDEAALLAAPGPVPHTPALAAAGWAALREQARRAGRQTIDTEVARADGAVFPARMELTYFEAVGAAFFLLSLSEQSRLHQAERELAQSERRFEAVVANATIGIIVGDRAGRIVSANGVAYQQFGYAEGALRGQLIEALVPQAAGRRHAQQRESFNAAPQVRAMGAHRGDLAGLRADGSVFPVEVSLSYFELNGELYAVAYVLDITAKKHADQALLAERRRVESLNSELEQKVADRTHALLTTLAQLEQRQAELAQALAAEQELGELKSRFVSMASHEFRTPLTAVLTSASLIGQYPAAEQQDKRLRHLDRIRQSVNQLNDILEEFLSVGRIEEGKVTAQPGHLNLPILLRDVLADLQGLLKPGQQVAQDIDCTEPMWLDASLLRKILVNLLSNASKYSAEGTLLQVQATGRAGRLTLVVQDAGVGIAPEDQARLFERFFRARNVTNVPGTGLGLYIVGRYVELLGGTIGLASELGQGTTVTIVIPYENAAAD